MPGEVGVLLAGGGEDRSQQIDLGDVLPDHLDVEHLLVHDVEGDIGTGAFEEFVLFTQIGRDYVGVTIDATEGEGEFDADLSRGADDKHFLFCHASGFLGCKRKEFCGRFMSGFCARFAGWNFYMSCSSTNRTIKRISFWWRAPVWWRVKSW